jgi:phosphate transport system substrate-binding protein
MFNRFLCSALLILSVSARGGEPTVDYIKQPGVAGSITSVGSDTLATLMSNWAGEFKYLYPQVKFQIQASGSSTAPTALTEGTANVGPMSREMKASEINDFVQQHGYAPLAIPVAVDAIVIYVDARNPIQTLSLKQVDGIFSSTRYCGGTRAIRNWQALGVASDSQYQSIKVFGRNAVSGTYGLFKTLALCDGDYRPEVNELPGSASVIQSVAYSNGAIGYAAFGHKTAAVRALSLRNSAGQAIPVSAQTIRSGQYPLSRFLYLVVNKKPNEALPLLEREFIRFVLSKAGQAVVEQEGYVSMTAPMLEQQRKRISQSE